MVGTRRFVPDAVQLTEESLMDLNDVLDRLAQLESRLLHVEDELGLSQEDAASVDVEPSVTTTAELVRQIGADDLTFGADRRLSISSGLIRVPSRRLFAVGGEQSRKLQVTALLDAMHWHRWSSLGGEGGITYMLGQGPNSSAAIQAIALLKSALVRPIDLSIQLDSASVSLRLPDLNEGSDTRLKQLRDRDAAVLPPLARSVEEKVRDHCFRWSRTLTGREWSGRVDGLEICRIDDSGQGVLRLGKVGKTGKESKARERFQSLVESDEFRFGEANLPAAVSLISCLAADRCRGVLSKIQFEHMLEARVLRSAVTLEFDGQKLEPVQSQFPAMWSEGDDPKYIDVIMRLDDVPWVVELKVPEGGGQGQYFRHAVGQVVLYREFIRRATGLHPWFTERGLDPLKCRAAVAFPMTGTETQRRRALDHVEYLASLFGVKVMVLPDDWNASDR
jgi:hypothetical protein